MDKKKLLLAAKLLELASEEFSNHGCNDLPDEFLFGWTHEELIQLDKDYHTKNGDPDEHDPNNLLFFDDGLMWYLAQELKKEAESNETQNQTS